MDNSKMEGKLSAAERKRLADEIRREIRLKTRNDWELSWDGNGANVILEGDTDTEGGRSLNGDKQTKWQERDFSSPCSSPTTTASATARAGEGRSTVTWVPDKSWLVREAPKPVVTKEKRQKEKRQKRRVRLEAEMKWNPGLRYWMAQRDAWTGARQRHVRRSSSPRRPSQHIDRGQARHVGPSASLAASAVSSTRSSSARTETRFSNCSSTEAIAGSPVGRRYSSSDVIEEVPVAPPLLPPTNLLRASITPKLYPEIYSNCVVKATTTAVPVNLADMTKVIVAGWKSDGQWPGTRPASDPQYQRPLKAVDNDPPVLVGGDAETSDQQQQQEPLCHGGAGVQPAVPAVNRSADRHQSLPPPLPSSSIQTTAVIRNRLSGSSSSAPNRAAVVDHKRSSTGATSNSKSSHLKSGSADGKELVIEGGKESPFNNGRNKLKKRDKKDVVKESTAGASATDTGVSTTVNATVAEATAPSQVANAHTAATATTSPPPSNGKKAVMSRGVGVVRKALGIKERGESGSLGTSHGKTNSQDCGGYENDSDEGQDE